MSSQKVIILGIGNPLMRDDGVGVRAIQILEQSALPVGIIAEFIDAGNAPDLSVFIDGQVGKLVIIDAVQSGSKPGTIYRFTSEILEESSAIFPHGLDILQSLAMMQLRGNLPDETVIIGIEPETMDYGTELSPEIERQLPEIVKAVIKEIGD